MAREGSLRRIAGDSYEDSKKVRDRGFSFLTDEESHKVWRPKFSLADVVAQNIKDRADQEKPSKTKKTVKHYTSVTLPLETMGDTSLSVKSLQADFHRRKRTRMNRVNFAWKVLQENPPEVAPKDSEQKPSGKERWRSAAMKVSREASDKKQTDFSLIVADLIAKAKTDN